MSAAEKLSAIAANVPLVYEAGRGACRTRHFVTTVVGDGSRALQVGIPFSPDFIAVNSFDPVVAAEAGAVMSFCADLRALSHLAGVATTARAGSPYSAGLSHGGLQTRYAEPGDGTVKIYDLPAPAGATAGVFWKDAPYVVVAQKHTDLTDEERVRAFMQRLEGKNGTLTLSRKIVTGAFPGADEENAQTGESLNEAWNELKRTYASGCTVAFA